MRLLSSLLLVALGFAPPLAGQQFDNPITLPVLISGSWTTLGVPPEPPPEEYEESEMGRIEVSLGVEEVYETTWENDTFAIQTVQAELQPNRPYALVIDSNQVSELELLLHAPSGYRLRVLDGPSGLDGKFVRYLNLEYPSEVILQVVLEPVQQKAGRTASMTEPTMGNILWAISLGQLATGKSAGKLSLAADEVTSDLVSPAWLQAVDIAGAVDVVRDSMTYDLLQVRFPAGLVVVEEPAEPGDIGYDLLWYHDADVGAKSGGLYPLIGTPTPWHRHEIRKVTVSSVDQFQVVSKGTGGGVMTKGLAVIRKLTNDWGIEGGEPGSFVDLGGRSDDVTYTPAFGGDVVEVEERFDPNSDVVERTWIEKKSFGSNLEVIARVRDPKLSPESDAVPEVTLYDYGAFRRLKSVRRPDGSWVAYRYFQSGPLVGMIEAIAEPWQDGPTAPPSDFDTSWDDGKLTVLDYEYGPVAGWEEDPASDRRPRVTDREVRILGRIVEQVQHSYVADERIYGVEVTTQRRSGPNVAWGTVPEEIQIMYDPEVPEVSPSLAGLPVVREEASGLSIVTRVVEGEWNGFSASSRFTAGGVGDTYLHAQLTGARGTGYGWVTPDAVDDIEDDITFVDGASALFVISGFHPIWLVPYQSTAEIEIRQAHGVILRETYAYIGSLTFQRLTWEESDQTSKGPEERRNHLGHVWSWTYEGQEVKTESLPGGVELVHTYDAQRRRTQTVRAEITAPSLPGGSTAPWQLGDLEEVVIAYEYDGADRKTSESVTSDGETLYQHWEYDLAGRVTEAIATCGQVTRYEYSSTLADTSLDIDWINQRITKVMTGEPESLTVLLSTTETSRVDGRPHSIAGTGAQPRRWDWGLVDDGSTWSYLQVSEFLVEDTNPSPNPPEVRRQVFNGRGQLREEFLPSAAPGGDWIWRYLQYEESRATLRAEHVYAPGLSLARRTLFLFDALGMESVVTQKQSASMTEVLDGNDRATGQKTSFRLIEGAWWLREDTFGWASAGSGDVSTLQRTDRRVTGFSSDLVAESKIYGMSVEPNSTATLSTLEAEERTWFDPATGLTTTESKTPGLDNGILTYGRQGRVEQITDATGSIERRLHDGLGRLTISQTWDRPGSHVNEYQRTTHAYLDGTTTLEQTRRLTGWDGSNPIEDIYTFGYEHCNRLSTISRAVTVDGSGDPDAVVTTRFGYDGRGRRSQRWGSAVEPEERVYDSYGRLAELRTFRDAPSGGWDQTTWQGAGATPDAVSWTRHPATGLVLAETDAAANATTYAYDGLNRQVLRETAAGRRRITEYSPLLGDHVATRYEVPGEDPEDPPVADDDTHNIVITYDRLGRPVTVDDELGLRQFVFDTSSDRRLLYEQLPSGYGETDYGARRITHQYDSQRRWNGYQLGSSTVPFLDADVTYAWDVDHGRMTGVTGEFDPGSNGSGTPRSWTYSYTGGSRQPGSVSTGGSGDTFATSYARSPERPALVTGADNVYDSTSIATYGYEWDRRGRLVEANQAGEMFEDLYGVQGLQIDYGYDDRDRLTSAATQWHNGSAWTALADRAFGVTYDHAGNRVQTTRYTTGSGGTQDHTVNELNQIEEFENVPRALVSGDAPTSASIELSDLLNPPVSPSRAHKYFYHAFEDVRINEGWAGVEVYVNSSLVDEIDVPVRQHEESRDFDADGNPTASGEMVYRYDGENRVIEQWWSNTGWPWARVRHTYDWQGRRARSQILFGTDPEAPTETVTFDLVYLGGRLISQVITSDSTTSGHEPTQELYLWGLDRSGTLEGAGTIGGLLAMAKGWDAIAAEHSLVAQDGLGNVVAYLNPATGERRAEFEYGAFGETLRTTANPSFGDYRTYEYGHRWQNKFSSAFLAGLDVPHPETYDFGLRSYEPSLGRWLNRDPIGVAGGSNVYAYVGNNPFGGWDAWGLEDEEIDWRIEGFELNFYEGSLTGSSIDPHTGETIHHLEDYHVGAYTVVGSSGGEDYEEPEDPDGPPDYGDDPDDGGGGEDSNRAVRWSDEKCKGLAAQIGSLQGALDHALNAMNGGRSFLDMSRGDFVGGRMAPSSRSGADWVSTGSDSLSVAGAFLMPWGSKTETAAVVIGGVSNIANTGLAGYAQSQGRYGDTLMHATAAVTDLMSVASNTIPALKVITVPVDIGKAVIGGSMILIDTAQTQSARSAAESTFGSHFDRMQSIERQKRADIGAQQALYNAHCK